MLWKEKELLSVITTFSGVGGTAIFHVTLGAGLGEGSSFLYHTKETTTTKNTGKLVRAFAMIVLASVSIFMTWYKIVTEH